MVSWVTNIPTKNVVLVNDREVLSLWPAESLWQQYLLRTVDQTPESCAAMSDIWRWEGC